MWHIDAEFIALAFMVVLMVDISFNKKTSALKDKIFYILACTTILAIIFDIISSYEMNLGPNASTLLLKVTLYIYFIITPLLSVLWLCYSLSIVYSYLKQIKILLIAPVIPFIFYILFILYNIQTGLFFTIGPNNEYMRGELFYFHFVIFYSYSFVSLIIAILSFRKNEKTTAVILCLFPIIVGICTYLQNEFRGYLLTGTSFTIVLFITYMFLQNRKITRDLMTGLYNRDACLSAVHKALTLSDNGYIIAISMNDFRLINQTFGQNIGDKLLKKIGEFLVSITPSKTAYRYSGDIFTIIIKKASRQQAEIIIDTILNRFKKPFLLEGLSYHLDCSIAAVAYPYKIEGKNDSVTVALDFAITESKRSHESVVFFTDELLNKIKRHHDIITAIDDAIKNDSFQIFLQPIYSIKIKKFTRAEALLRLTDKNIGSISPAEFIPVAEQTGQIVEITYKIIDNICGFIKENELLFTNPFCISVNLSMVQFMQSDLAEKIKEILIRHNLAPDKIRFEITESVAACSFENIKVIMDELCDFGTCFALDDYGLGYSNISYLTNLPFSTVKLDKSIIDTIESDKTIAPAIITMFKSLNRCVVAEGVETKEQSDTLIAASCDLIQGYYYAKPMDMPSFTAFIKAHN